MKLTYSADDLLKLFSPATLARGRRYQQEGRVMGLKVVRDGRRLVARVKGSATYPYYVAIQLPAQGDATAIETACTCPMACRCKHAAAVMIQALVEAGARSWPTADPESLDTPGDDAHPGHGLSREAQQWIERLQQALIPGDKADDAPRHLLYLLQPRPQHPWTLGVGVVTAKLTPDGSYGHPRIFPWHRPQSAGEKPPEADQGLLAELRQLSRDPHLGSLEGPAGLSLLTRLLATGRCHWQTVDTPPLTLGGTRSARVTWHSDDDGHSRLQLALGDEASTDAETGVDPPGEETTVAGEATGVRVFALFHPWYVDLHHHRCGPVDAGLSPPLAAALASSPSLGPEELPQVQAWLRTHLADVDLPPPPEVAVEEVDDVEPQPVLVLYSLAPHGTGHSRGPALEAARLNFDYQGHTVAWNDDGEAVVQRLDKGLRRLKRHGAFEQSCHRRLTRWGLRRLVNFSSPADLPPESDGDFGFPDPANWIPFLLHRVPTLEAAGWRLEREATFRLELLEPDGWALDVESSGIDWFGLALGVEIDGQTVNILPLLVDYLTKLPTDDPKAWLTNLDDDRPLALPLGDGRLLAIPAKRLKAVLEVLIELFDHAPLNADGRLALPDFQAGRLLELDAGLDGLGFKGDRRWWARAEQLGQLKTPQPVPPPDNLQAALRPYQCQGLTWLQFLAGGDLGGVLADDMGLGKTLQTLAHLLLEKSRGRLDRPALVIAPTSLVANWQREAARFAPDLRVLLLYGPSRRRHFGSIPHHDLVITSYALLRIDHPALVEHPYHAVILDEAQMIKNPRSKSRQWLQDLTSRHRLCLTGTPMENHLGELWSLFDFALPGLLGDAQQFQRLFRRPVERHGDAERLEHLRRRVRPFLLRRTKSEVAGDLPPKTDIVRSVALQGDQRDLYESIRAAMEAKVRAAIKAKGLSRSHITILEALLKLRQVCCDPRLVNLQGARHTRRSVKLTLLFELLPSLLEDGRQVLLFSQFTSMLELIERELRKRRQNYLKLTGATQKRQPLIDRFQGGEVPLFLISLKAGGMGLNLTAADAVIHYDPWWNPAVEDQATDRAHRIGQEKPVFVYRLLTEGTVETRIRELQERKRSLFQGLLEGQENAAPRWSDEDLRFLLAPLDATLEESF